MTDGRTTKNFLQFFGKFSFNGVNVTLLLPTDSDSYSAANEDIFIY